jgi:hypothetical protein
MDRQSNLTAADLRRRLLDHAHDPAASMDKVGASSVGVDSEFERLVMKDLKIKGFRFTPTVEGRELSNRSGRRGCEGTPCGRMRRGSIPYT